MFRNVEATGPCKIGAGRKLCSSKLLTAPAYRLRHDAPNTNGEAGLPLFALAKSVSCEGGDRIEPGSIASRQIAEGEADHAGAYKGKGNRTYGTVIRLETCAVVASTVSRTCSGSVRVGVRLGEFSMSSSACGQIGSCRSG